jgi:hypothetical protein
MEQVYEKLKNMYDIQEALILFGEDKGRYTEVDICEDGSAYLGLTQILPKGTLFTIEEV